MFQLLVQSFLYPVSSFSYIIKSESIIYVDTLKFLLKQLHPWRERRAYMKNVYNFQIELTRSSAREIYIKSFIQSGNFSPMLPCKDLIR
jgi:hypothetical protein